MSPPSGYSHNAISGMAGFLRQTGKDFLHEYVGDLAAGLTKEQQVLRVALTRPQFEGRKFERGTLELTLGFYDAAEAGVKNGTYHDLETALTLLPGEFERRLNKLHLDSDGALTER